MELSYERRGSGPPLVLLHGLGHHWQAFLPVLDLLARERDVIAVDLPGFGASPPLSKGAHYDGAGFADAIESFCRGLGLEGVHVAGNSLGGYVALTLAARGVVRSATALSPACFWTRAEHAYARTMIRSMRRGARLAPRELQEVLVTFPAGRAIMAGVIAARPALLDPEALLASAAAMAECEGFEPTLAALAQAPPPEPATVPITIAWGERDRLLFPAQGARAARWAGQPTVRLRGCGHVPMSDDPELVARVLLHGSSAG